MAKKQSMVELAHSQRECAQLERKISEYIKQQQKQELREAKLLQKQEKESLKQVMEQTIYQQKQEIESLNEMLKSNRKNMSVGSLDVSNMTINSIKQNKMY